MVVDFEPQRLGAVDDGNACRASGVLDGVGDELCEDQQTVGDPAALPLLELSAKFVASVADLACTVSLQLDASARHVKVSNLDCFTSDMHRLYPTRGAVSRSAATFCGMAPCSQVRGESMAACSAEADRTTDKRVLSVWVTC